MRLRVATVAQVGSCFEDDDWVLGGVADEVAGRDQGKTGCEGASCSGAALAKAFSIAWPSLARAAL
jgi:hypothetical protein